MQSGNSSFIKAHGFRPFLTGRTTRLRVRDILVIVIIIIIVGFRSIDPRDLGRELGVFLFPR